MAGGKFDKLVGKTRPGTYINFESTRNDTLGNSGRGIVLIPLIGHNYGPSKEFITIYNSSPDAQYAKLGYSVYDKDPNNQMLMIREALKNASSVIVYNVSSGERATGTGGGINARAKYGGTRGNALSYSVSANPVKGFDVKVYIDGMVLSGYEGIEDITELTERNDAYIDFTGDGELEAVAGVTLTGGTDVTAVNSDISKFLDDMEGVKFNCLAFPVTDKTLQTACKSKIKYLRDNVGKGVQAVVPDFAADYEGIINVTNSVSVDGVKLSHAQVTAWVAGVTASAKNTSSNTYVEYEEADEIIGAKTNEEAVAAIKAGELFFSYSEEGKAVIEYDINSLISFKDGKDESYRKNRVIRVFDTFAESIQLNFPPNKFDNNSIGWGIMEGIGKTILKQYEEAGAIKNVDYDNDFLVDRTISEGDRTYFNIGLEPVDSAEKLYFTVSTR